MKIHALTTLLFLFYFNSAYVLASDNLRIPDIRSLGTGGNGVTQTSFFNPSLIALAGKKNFQIHYYNKYLIKELGTVTGSFLCPNSFLPIGIHISSFGYDDYRESMIRISAAKLLNEKWTLGIGLHYSFLQTALFDERPARLSTDIGCSFLPIDNLLIGLLIMNFPSVSIGDKRTDINDFMEYNIQTGIEWKVINTVSIISSISRNKKHFNGSLGIEYMPVKDFYLRCGVQADPLLPSLGIGYDFSLFSMDVVGVYHPVLGISSGLGLSISF